MAIQQKWLKSKDMRFVQIINQKKFTLVTIFLFLYVLFNLMDGERGLISYFEKKKIKEQLINEKNMLSADLALVEKHNMLLKSYIDLDYLEMLYRQKFMVGISNEHIYII